MERKEIQISKLIFDTNVYSIKAAKHAAYDLRDNATFKIYLEDSSKIVVMHQQ